MSYGQFLVGSAIMQVVSNEQWAVASKQQGRKKIGITLDPIPVVLSQK